MRLILSLPILLAALERISVTHGAFISTTITGSKVDTFSVPLVHPIRIWGKSSFGFNYHNDFSVSSTMHAKPKKVTSDIALDLDDMGAEPMSLKDQMKAKKEAEKNAKKATDTNSNNNKKKDATPNSVSEFNAFDDDEPLSMKDKIKLQKQAEKSSKKTHGTESKNLDFVDIDEPLSMKEKMKLQKESERNGKKMTHEEPKQEEPMEIQRIETKIEETSISPQPLNPDISTSTGGKQDAKSAKALKALELMERLEAEMAAQDVDEQPKLSKKELKELEKKAAKKAMKEAKKGNKVDLIEEDEESDDAIESSLEGESAVESSNSSLGEDESVQHTGETISLEEKVRKERPPPRIRVMESAQPNYSSLRLENVGVIFRDTQVLKDVTWGVQTGDRIGLVGQNGAGKTTQVRIMAGELEPTTGDLVKSSKDLRVAVLRQEFIDDLVLDRTLKAEFMSVFEEENKIIEELRASEIALETMSGENTDQMQEILDRMQDLQSKAESKGIYALESKAKKVMNLMGFEDDEENFLVSMFSGGWKMRIGLGKVLLKDPNILLLDEPTNHLDLESVEWLEQFLIQQNIPMVIVSHDREFLDRVCTKIVDAEGGICTEYDGNYSRFLELKKAKMDAWHAAFEGQEKRIRDERKWINEFKLKQPQATKQREDQLEKFMKSDEYVKKPPFTGKPFKFRFPDAPRLSPEVANIKGLSHSYGPNRLFDDCSLFIEKNDRIATIGPNGSGKSTLLRLLTGKEKPDVGSAEIIGQNIVVNYFEQNQADALDLEITVVETIQRNSNGQSYNELRALLGQFLFKGDSVEKKVRNLSGGEKARLSLACMMLRPANLLILDEPTNHLDIPAKEMLEEALQNFQGSVIIVSHDRYFISRVATTIVAIEDKKLVKYAGDYKSYMDKVRDVKDKVEARYVKGVAGIESVPVIEFEEVNRKTKNFGGSSTSHMVSRKDKGVKNAKRTQELTI